MANNIDININAQELVNTISQAVQEIGGKVASSTLELLEKSSPMIVKTLEEGVKSDYIYYQTQFVASLIWVIVLPLVIAFLIGASLYWVARAARKQDFYSENICFAVVMVSVLLGTFSVCGLLVCTKQLVSNYTYTKQIEAAPTYYAAKKAMELISTAKESL
jgi:hypothetical protein